MVLSVSGGFHRSPAAELSGMSKAGPSCGSPLPCAPGNPRLRQHRALASASL